MREERGSADREADNEHGSVRDGSRNEDNGGRSVWRAIYRGWEWRGGT